MHNNKVLPLAAALIAIAIISSCSRVPITNRKQLNLIPESEMISMSLTAYKNFIDSNVVLPATDPKTVMVRGIGNRIKDAVTQFLTDAKDQKRIAGFEWEFNVVQQDVVNAWCMPGGKVVVYTGILPVTKDEASLAVVMGHEIAHAVARHGNERMSQGLALNAAGATLAVVLSEKPQLARDLFLQAYGVGGTLGMLAYSRAHESEADKLGLVFMSMAGYNPETAVAFWERMKASSGQKPPEILSTHPSDDTRIAAIKEFMPEAKKYYKPRQ
jgi:predicted Zn-dependent protease